MANLDVIFFIYGGAFVLMGVTILILPKKESEFKLANYIWLLGLFGIVHGANEWLDMWAIIKGRIATLDSIRWFCLVVSYAFLFEFGRRLFIDTGKKSSDWRKSASRYLRWWLIPALGTFILVIAFVSDDFWKTGSILARYFLGFTGAALAGSGFLHYYYHERAALEPLNIKKYFIWAGFSFLAFGLLSGLIVPKGDFFPSNRFNQELFMSTFGVPVQFFRAGFALVVAWSVAKMLAIFKWETENRLSNALKVANGSKKALELQVGRMENALFRADDVLNLLSKPPNIIPFFVTSPMYRSARTIGGGDSLRWLNFRSQYAGIYLHDVSGHDIQEILLNILATAATDDLKINPSKKSVSVPSVFLTDMNEHLRRFCAESHHYVTAVYLLMNFDSREIMLSLAGHPKPLLIEKNGRAVSVGEPGFMMGQFEIKPESNERYRDISLKLENGQLLLIYSDGLMEQKDNDGITFATKLKKDILPRLEGLNPDEAYETLKKEFGLHLGGNTPEDDVSFMFLSSRPSKKYRILEFVPDPKILEFMKKRARDFYHINLRKKHESGRKSTALVENSGFKVINKLSESYAHIIEELSKAGWPQKDILRVKAALCELVTNAIIHGNMCSDRFTVKVSHILYCDVLEVCAADEGEGFKGSSLAQTVEEVDLLKEHGRGLHMVKMYSDKMYFNEAGNKCWVIFTKNGGLADQS